MTTRTWSRMAFAGLLAGTLAACAGRQEKEQRAQAPPPTPAEQAQRAAQQAAQQAQQADKDLAAAQQRLKAAHQEAVKAEQAHAQARQAVVQAEQQAVQAQQRVAQERSTVQQLDAQVQQRREQAAVAAEQAAFAAEQAQGLQSAQGRITEASPWRVVLETEGGRRMSFDVDQRTRVMMRGEQRSVAELQQGADARVAYDPRGNVPAAVAIHVSPARNRAAQPPPAQQEPQQPQPQR